MTSIVYESDIDVKLDIIRLNGEEGAIRVYANEEDFEQLEEVAVFENVGAAYEFVDQLERSLVAAGLHREGE